MSAPASMSQFLSQSVEDFLAQRGDAALAQRLSGLFQTAGVIDVGMLTTQPAEVLTELGVAGDDLHALREHLAYFDVRLIPGPQDLNRKPA